MAQIHGNVGSLSRILGELKKNDVTFLTSLEEILKFENEFNSLISEKKTSIIKSNREKNNTLREQIETLTVEYDAKIKSRSVTLVDEQNRINSALSATKPYFASTDGVFSGLKHYLKKSNLQRRKQHLSTHFYQEVRRPFSGMYGRILSLKRELLERETHFDKIVTQEVENKNQQIITAKRILEENSPALLGAIGEAKVLNELKKLPDSYYVINDFRHNFSKALHHRSSGGWIQTIQVDHLLIGPQGVSIIETKNWSKDSVQNLNLFSPVNQVERTSYAIFVLLNRKLDQPASLNHPWGRIKIPVHSIILMINNKPNQEFQNVRILTLNSLNQYIRNMKSIFEKDAVQCITNMLLNANGSYSN